jgi:tRNA nucleotidyltransferase (CCA-adding enzyme)
MDEQLIAKKIHDAGGNLYLVGGAVRDEIMGKPFHDKDYCITGLDENDFIRLFPKASIVGKDFPVFLMDGAEFALARKERKISKGYKGFEINTSKDITIQEDLKRRDITINAIAKEVLTGKLIDPYDGIKDIKNKIIRHVSTAFSEDPLRAYRTARFAAQFEYEIDNKTYELMYFLKDELNTINSERVFIELKKALSTNKPSIFFNVLKRANILDVHFKEINDLIGVIQPEKYHPEGDAYNHTMIVLDEVSKNTKDESVRYAALVHDLGKAKTPKDILPQHIGHEILGIECANNLSQRINVPNKWKKRGQETVKYHMKAGIYTNMRPYKKAIFLNTINRTSIGIDNLQIIVNADDMLKRPKINFSETGKIVLNKINGKFLISKGITPQSIGKEKFLNRLYEEQAKLIENIEKDENLEVNV